MLTFNFSRIKLSFTSFSIYRITGQIFLAKENVLTFRPATAEAKSHEIIFLFAKLKHLSLRDKAILNGKKTVYALHLECVLVFS